VDKTSGGSVTRTVTYYPAGGAMRINSTLYYILKDHLGSASVVTDASGNILGEQRYYPFGETRLTTGTIYTDKLFTGQREMTGLGIYHYGARFYSPKIGRFLSADSIVPGYANPQNLNRMSYVTNNPLRYTDPTGHMMTDEGGGGCLICNFPPPDDGGGGGDDDPRTTDPDTDNDGVPDVPDPSADPVTLGSHSDPECTPMELVECFYRRGRLPSGEWNITEDQLNQLMLAVYYDIHGRPVSLSDWLDRKIYDTPFWDGYDKDIGSVCTNSTCYNRTEVNYIAQGMYSAKYEGSLAGKAITHGWKFNEYGHTASPGTIFWFQKGFDFYTLQTLPLVIGP